MAAEKTKISFEENINILEDIVRKLESGDVGLEEMLTLFEEGIHRTKECAAQLKNAENKITMLVESENGKMIEKDFDVK